MIVYGKNVIKEAILNGRPIYKLYIDQKSTDRKFIEFVENKKIPFEYKDKGFLNNITNQGIHNGVVADVKDYKIYELDQVILENKTQKFLMLDEIQDPHNLGAIMRSAEATQVDGIIMSKKHQVPLSGVVAKTSSGAIEYVKVIVVSNLHQAILKLKEYGHTVVGTSDKAKGNYKDIPKTGNITIIMGNEGVGLRPLIEKNCDMLVSIPMLGKVNSLNVSVATALLLYELI